MTALAGLLAGLAAWLGVRPGGRRLLRRLQVTATPGLRVPRAPLLLPTGALVAVVALLSAPGAVAGAAALVAASVTLLARRRRRDKAVLATTQEAARACRLLDALLAQGHVPAQALIRAATDCPILAPAAATAELGGDTAAVLRQLAARPGADGLAEVARAWDLTERTGAPLHRVLARAKTNLMSQADLAAVIAQELAGPRATGQLLAVLPFLGLGLAAVAGGDPFAFLTGTVPGRICLLGGVGLASAGAVWSDLLATRAARLTPLARRRRR
jgi:tight adherence protein B